MIQFITLLVLFMVSPNKYKPSAIEGAKIEDKPILKSGVPIPVRGINRQLPKKVITVWISVPLNKKNPNIFENLDSPLSMRYNQQSLIAINEK